MIKEMETVFDYVTPDIVQDNLKENGWKQKSTIEAKQFVERRHGNNDGTGGPMTIKDGIDDNQRYIDMTSINFKNRFEKDNVFQFDEKGNFGVNTAIENNVAVGLYRGDYTGDKKGTEPHDFANIVFPYIHAGVGGEATLAYNGDDMFKPEIGIRGYSEFQGRIKNDVDAIARISSQITDEDKISAYYAHSLHNGAYYPIDIGGMTKGYMKYGDGYEVGIGYDKKIDNDNEFGIEAFYKKVQAGIKNENSYEPDNDTIGVRFNFKF